MEVHILFRHTIGCTFCLALSRHSPFWMLTQFHFARYLSLQAVSLRYPKNWISTGRTETGPSRATMALGEEPGRKIPPTRGTMSVRRRHDRYYALIGLGDSLACLQRTRILLLKTLKEQLIKRLTVTETPKLNQFLTELTLACRVPTPLLRKMKHLGRVKVDTEWRLPTRLHATSLSACSRRCQR